VGCCNWWAMILWPLFKYWVSYRHLIFIINTFELLIKAVQNLIHYSWIFNVQLYVHFKKWTLKFKLLYLLNHISYFNKICRICRLNTHIQSLKVWLKSVLPWLKYRIFSRGLFFIGAPCRFECSKIRILWFFWNDVSKKSWKVFSKSLVLSS